MNITLIQNYIKELNSEKIVPQSFYKRNSPYYTFVSYINHSAACFMSENYDGTILFLHRAYQEYKALHSHGKMDEHHRRYFNLCKSYIKITSSYVVEHGFVDNEWKEKVKIMEQDSLLQ